MNLEVIIYALLGAMVGLAVALVISLFWDTTLRAIRRIAANNNWSNRKAYFIAFCVGVGMGVGIWVQL